MNSLETSSYEQRKSLDVKDLSLDRELIYLYKGMITFGASWNFIVSMCGITAIPKVTRQWDSLLLIMTRKDYMLNYSTK